MILKEIPQSERPREKALQDGVKQLSNIELLAILLRTGTKHENVLTLAQNLLYRLENLQEFRELTIFELTEQNGIGTAKALTVLAAIELGYRIVRDFPENIVLASPEQVVQYLNDRMVGMTQEHLYALYLNSKGMLISCKLITKGTINSTLIDAKLIFKWVYKLSASAVIIVHNHPSGDPNPSLQDLKMTEEVVKQAKIMGITIIDHIIIGRTYYSMKQNNRIFKTF